MFSRGILVLVVQLSVSMGVTALGVWALLWPTRLQRFVNANYALLPAPSEWWRPTPTLLRLVGVFLIWYGYTLAAAYRDELLWLARLFEIVRPSAPG
jgi:hypothetical protein